MDRFDATIPRPRPWSRRSFLRACAVAAASGTLRPWRALAAQPASDDRAVFRAGRAATARNVIVLWMDGGPSQIDTFDMKPGTKVAGYFAPIETNVDGIRICEHLPQLARRADRFAIVRSLASIVADHPRARQYAHTCFTPSETVVHPWFLSSAAAELLPRRAGLPPCVVVGRPQAGGGYLGEDWTPFVVANPLTAAAELRRPDGVSASRHRARLELLQRMNRDFSERRDCQQLITAEETTDRALAFIDADVAGAFDLHAEAEAIQERYGASRFGQGCLLARRLVEHGVRFVEVQMPGWDTHLDNFDVSKQQMAVLDPVFSTLLDDLEGRGLLGETLVLWMGEFGRTPTINKDVGRDHHWRCFSVVLAGGGIRGGQVVGATDKIGDQVLERPVSMGDLFATVYAALGVSHHRTFQTPSGRPVPRLEQGEPIAGLLAG